MQLSTTHQYTFKKDIFRPLYGLFLGIAIALGTTNMFEYVFTNVFCVFSISFIFLLNLINENNKKLAQISFVLLIIFITFYHMFINPPEVYRQNASIWNMTSSASIRLGAEKIIVSEKYANAFEKLQDAAIENGFLEGTPIIDLSGTSPGLVYVLDGRSFVYPWLVGSYDYSSDFARSILSEWPRGEIQKAWVLTANSFRELPDVILSEQNIEFPSKFTKIVSISLPLYNGMTVDLWKPN
jgi:hypothetical protein